MPAPPDPRPPRATWAGLTEVQLLAQCEVDTYRASGPGGQKRNKTSSAVRLRHLPSGLLVIAEESRSQHENKARAVRRLWQALFLHLRDPLPPGALTPEAVAAHPDHPGSLDLSPKNPRFWPAAGLVLDLLAAVEARVSDAAALLGVSTGHLIDFLQADPKVWQEANRLRAAAGHRPLKSGQ
jgi:hypothetical protein